MILKVLDETKKVEHAGMGWSPQFKEEVTGNYEMVCDVSGSVEVNAILKDLRKPTGWNENLQAICKTKSKAVPLAIHQVGAIWRPYGRRTAVRAI